MIFLDPWFWMFAAVALAGFWLCPRAGKVYWLLASSAVFHWHVAGPAGVVPIVLLALGTYGLGLVLARRRSRPLFAAGIVGLVAALGYYKYAGFLLRQAAAGLGALGMYGPAWLHDFEAPRAPLAISFFTFLFIHYLFEIHVHGRAPVRSPIRFGLFAIFFPTLAAGPLRRYPDFDPQLDGLHNPSRAHVVAGAERIVRGLLKKVCIADLLVIVIAELQAVPRWTAPGVLVLALLQGWRTYYDFAGYTDVAIGLGQLLGVRVPENFHRPFGATSLGEFWRRWHMSLSFWIRDYVYVPLGGNAFLAMTIFGLWHGAGWNYVLWGALHGAGLTLEGRVRRHFPGVFHRGPLRTTLRRAVFLAFLTYTWLVFWYPPSTVWAMTTASIRWCLGG
jgi:alginate O-acetyltransferase complex protein AlgI